MGMRLIIIIIIIIIIIGVIRIVIILLRVSLLLNGFSQVCPGCGKAKQFDSQAPPED